jgi:hypothetical protein
MILALPTHKPSAYIEGIGGVSGAEERVDHIALLLHLALSLMGTSIGRSESGSFVAVWLAGAVGSLFE